MFFKPLYDLLVSWWPEHSHTISVVLTDIDSIIVVIGAASLMATVATIGLLVVLRITKQI